MIKNKKPTIGFIGQGFIGKNYADDFERRKYTVIRYALEPQYVGNKERISECDIVFVAVPTPTTPKGFDGSLVDSVLSLVGKGKIVVIKSTIPPGMTARLQKKYPGIVVLHSPEFLSEVTAKADAMKPFVNIVGMSKKSPLHARAAETVMGVLPKAPKQIMCTSEESEIIKYTHNCSGFFQIIFFNMMYDLSKKFKADWSVIHEAVKADPYIPNRYADPIHKSGRGAGGHCFIKDFATFVDVYEDALSQDVSTRKILNSMEQKNIELLQSTKKDIELLRGVYGSKIKK